MSKTWYSQYRYQVCPFCNSKKIKPVGIFDFRDNQWFAEAQPVNRTGYLCDNCKRYHLERDHKYITDRKEIRRDIKKLHGFLGED